VSAGLFGTVSVTEKLPAESGVAVASGVADGPAKMRTSPSLVASPHPVPVTVTVCPGSALFGSGETVGEAALACDEQTARMTSAPQPARIPRCMSPRPPRQ
jgi:hypothetical protein